MCGDYYIGGRRFSSLSDLIGYYSYVSCLLKGEKLLSPVAPPEVRRASTNIHANKRELMLTARFQCNVDHFHASSASRRPQESEGHTSIHQSAGY